MATAKSGAYAVLFDENRNDAGASTQDNREGWSEQARKLGAEVRFKSVVWGLFKDNVLGVIDEESSYQVRADRIILATGSTDVACPFPGGSLPGVFTIRAMSVMIHQWNIFPWKRFVLIGEGDETDDLQEEIRRLGGEVVAKVSASTAPSIQAFGEQGVEAVRVSG